MLDWLRSLFGRPAPKTPRATATRTAPAARAEIAPAFPARRSGPESPDALAPATLPEDEDALFGRIAHRIDQGKLELPHLPSTATTLLALTSSGDADAAELAGVIETDPVLSSELLREANSVAAGARVAAETLQDAIARVGLRRVRSLVLSISMRGVMLKNGRLRAFAADAWRQAYSAGTIARTIAPVIGIDPERAFLFGLLQDIGKVALLNGLSEEPDAAERATQALVGKLFLEFHEWAGRETAVAWKLPAEIAAVCSRHHDYRANEVSPVGAALARLAHKMDLFLAQGAETEYRALARGDELDALDVPADRRHELLTRGLEAYRAHSDGAQVDRAA